MKKLIISTITLLALAGLFLFDAAAGTGGAQFDAWNAEFVGWLDGAPGKTLMVGMFLVAAYYGIVEPRLDRCGIAVAFGVILANAQTVIDAFLTASIAAPTL